jgi:antitoxin VapB
VALNIGNPEIERLAAQAAELGRESETEAIRKALEERVARLSRRRHRSADRDQRIQETLARVRVEFPNGDFGRTLTKVEEEEILGFGPDGV